MKKALFLDRDGVVNIDYGHVGNIENFVFMDGIFETVKKSISLSYIPIIVTNQAGIAKGHYSEDQFFELTSWMISVFNQNMSPITAVYYCPFHESGIPPYNVANHPDRKPNPGMLLRAASEYDINLRASVLIGDQRSDHLCAAAANVPNIGAFGYSGQPDHPATATLPDHTAAQFWLSSLG